MSNTEIVTTLEQYRYVVQHLLNHISNCKKCSCKLTDILGELNLD